MWKGAVDIRDSSLAHSIEHGARELIQEIEMEREPRALEHRIQEIQKLIDQADDQGVITPNDKNNLWHSYDRLRQEVRKLPNY